MQIEHVKWSSKGCVEQLSYKISTVDEAGFNCAGTNFIAVSIRVSSVTNLDDSTIIQAGNKNKLTSVSYGGGDAGGGNATITYSMQNNNDFVVLHSGDPISMLDTAYFKNWFT